MLHMKVNCRHSASVSGISSLFFFSAHWLVSLPDLTESPLDMARKLLQGAITAARGLLNPQFDGLRIGQEDLKRDEEKKIAHP